MIEIAGEGSMANIHHELIVRGDLKHLRGFLRGYQLGKRLKSGLLFCADQPINTHHLKEILTLHGDYVHLICRDRLREGLVTAVRSAVDLEFEIIADRPIIRSAFGFKFKTVSRRVGNQLKKMFSRIPADLRLSQYEPEEIVDPSAKGVELYSPRPEYVFRGRGEVEGNIERLLRYHGKLAAHEFVDTELIQIYD
jgi:hypothetical protein